MLPLRVAIGENRGGGWIVDLFHVEIGVNDIAGAAVRPFRVGNQRDRTRVVHPLHDLENRRERRRRRGRNGGERGWGFGHPLSPCQGWGQRGISIVPKMQSENIFSTSTI